MAGTGRWPERCGPGHSSDGLVERRIYNKRPLRYEYHLTEKGEPFYPVLLALRAWGEKWCKAPDEGLAVRQRLAAGLANRTEPSRFVA
jgi:HxlR-like helix-turn-helix